jgi:hypothetical protein
VHVGEFLRSAAGREWPGDWPCGVYLNAYLMLRGYPDIAAPCFAEGSKKLASRIRRARGLAPYARRLFAKAGIPEVDAAQAGDFGVIARQAADGAPHVFAIYGGERWVSVGAEGLEAGPAEALAIWRPAHG